MTPGLPLATLCRTFGAGSTIHLIRISSQFLLLDHPVCKRTRLGLRYPSRFYSMVIKPLPKTKRILKKSFLIFFGFLIGAIIAEIGLRASGYSYPGFYTVDQTRGYALLPGMEGWYRKEGESYVRINSAGLRDREHSKAKAPDTIRIALLGDSHAEALQVQMEQAFWAIIEQRLQACRFLARQRIEIINFGVSGYSTAQELITLREHVWDYAPDIVLLTITTNNDISDNSRALKKTDEVPYFIYRDGTLALDDSFRTSRSFLLRQSKLNRLGRWIKDRSRFVQAVNQVHHGFKILLASWKSRPSAAETPPPAVTSHQSGIVTESAEVGIDNIIYVAPTSQVWNDAWRVTEGLIGAMRDEVKNRGAKFVVVTLSNGPQVLPDPNARRAFMYRFGVTDLFYPDHRIRSLAKREGIPVITLAPELQTYAEQNKIFLHGFGKDVGNGHWNADGHRVAGELIAQKLCEGVVGK